MKFKLLANKNFSLLIFGEAISLLGNSLQSFILGLVVFKITGSASSFASIMALMIIPKIILSPVAGVISDNFNRKRIIVFLDLISGIVTFLFALILHQSNTINLIYIYIYVIFLSIVETLYIPTNMSILPLVIDVEELGNANAINSAIINCAQLLAPVLSVFLYEKFSIEFLVFLNALSFIICSIFECFIDIKELPKENKKLTAKVIKSDIVEGFNYIKNNKVIKLFVLVRILLNFALIPVTTTGYIVIAKKILMMTDYQYSSLQTVISIGYFIAPFIATAIMTKYSMKYASMSLVFINGMLVLTLMFVTLTYNNIDIFKGMHFILFLLIAFVVAIITGTVGITMSVLFQQEIEIDKLGRVSSIIRMMLQLFIPISQLMFGFFFDKLNINLCLLLSSLIIILPLCFINKTVTITKYTMKS